MRHAFRLLLLTMHAWDHSGTVTVNDTLDLLAEHMGVGEEVAELTKKVGVR